MMPSFLPMKDLQDRIRELEATVEEQLRTIVALNSCIGGAGSNTTENLTRVDELEAELAELRKQQGEPVKIDTELLDHMVEAFERLIEAHHDSSNPFHSPVNSDAELAMRHLKGIVTALKTTKLYREAAPKQQTKSESQQLLDAGFKRRPTFRALPSDE